MPKYAEKAQDLEALKKSVDEAATVGGGLWLSYLLALFYLMVASGSVTHTDLFFERPINLLFLNVQLPIVAFFALAPLLFLALHAFTLANLVMLTAKAKRFHLALYEQIGETAQMSDEERRTRKRIRDGLRGQLPSNVFVQFLAGPPELRGGIFGWTLRAIGWVTLALGPVALLLLFQIQFLPYHSAFITWSHRLGLGVDLALIWWLWRDILKGREPDEGVLAKRRSSFTWVWAPIGVTFTLAVAIFSTLIATYQGESIAVSINSFDHFGAIAYFHDKVFHSDIVLQNRRKLFISDTLVLRRVNALEVLNIDGRKDSRRAKYIFIAGNRDLVGAEFQDAVLPNIDFSFSYLDKANFSGAKIDHVSFEHASLDGAILKNLDKIQLEGVTWKGVNLRGADLSGANLQGVSLTGVDLEGADLQSTSLQGAQLDEAILYGVALGDAKLQGASLVKAKLDGADLTYADLRVAGLSYAELRGSALDGATILGASIFGASLQGTSFDGAFIEATDFREAKFWRSQAGELKIRNIILIQLFDTFGPQIFSSIERHENYDDTEKKHSFTFKKNYKNWSAVEYHKLLDLINNLPDGQNKELATLRILRLDCADKSLASCDSDTSRSPPSQFTEWRDKLLAANISDEVFSEKLAAALRSIVCAQDENLVFVTRSEVFFDRLEAAGVQAAKLIADLSDKSGTTCPVAAMLTDDDRAKLAKYKVAATNENSPNQK